MTNANDPANSRALLLDFAEALSRCDSFKLSKHTCDPRRAKRSAAKPAAKKARKKAAAAKASATGSPSIETVVVGLLKANGAPMAVPEILAAIKKQKLVKTRAGNFDGVLRQAMSKSSKIKRVRRGVYRA